MLSLTSLQHSLTREDRPPPCLYRNSTISTTNLPKKHQSITNLPQSHTHKPYQNSIFMDPIATDFYRITLLAISLLPPITNPPTRTNFEKISNPKSQTHPLQKRIHLTQGQQRQILRSTSSSIKASTTSKALTQRRPKWHCRRRGQNPPTAKTHPRKPTHNKPSILGTNDRSTELGFSNPLVCKKWGYFYGLGDEEANND